MKKSLKFKMTLILIVVMSLLILLCWLLNRVFLERYYQISKVNSIRESYSVVNRLSFDSEMSEEEFFSEIEHVENTYSVNVYIVSEITAFLGRPGFKFIYPISADSTDFGTFSIIRNDRFARVGKALQKYIFLSEEQDNDQVERLATEKNQYDVYKFFDDSMNSFFIDLVGFIESGYLVFIRSGYENIHESADISGKFLAIIGLFTIIVGSVVMLLFSRSFTKPILELADISDKMAKLDFDSHYGDTERRDEIGKLGNSINEMSQKLEKDIAHKLEIDELRKEFLSNVSHELKTPIALIQGYAEGLIDNVNDDPLDREYYCEVIIDESRKMNDMVKKLLSLNEIEFGSNRLDIERFDIVSMARGIASSIDILAKNRQISVIFDDREPLYVWGDEGLIEEVLTNYISNALNHADGLRQVRIAFTEQPDEKIRISVFNTGKPIPEESLDNIWVKFYKVDKARTREYGGSGIGLSIVKAIMEQHNQGYGVINHENGVEFWFELERCTA